MVFNRRAVRFSFLASFILRRLVSPAPLLLLWTAILAITPLQAQRVQVRTRHVRPEVSDHRAALVGAMPASQQIHASIVLPLRNPDALKSLLGRLYDPSSADYRHFLSVAQFTSQFGPSSSDFDAAVAFAQSNGFTVGELPANRLVVPITGTAAQMNTAFNVRMNVYQHPTENRTFFSPDREPSTNPGVPIFHIAGLDDFSLPRHMSLKKSSIASARGSIPSPDGQQAAVLGSGPGGSYLGSDMRAAYYGGTTLDGNGQVLAVLEFGGYSLNDVNLTFSNAGQTYQVPINNVLLDGASAGPVGNQNDAEQALDIVQAIGMAPGLSQVRVYIGLGSDDPSILNSMASENLAKQISCSWGWRPADPSVDDVFFQEMAAQGQSFFTASGDDGAYDAAINPFFYPADDQYVTAVGGTHLTTTGAAGTWVSETVWNSGGGGSGGGISPDGISIPSWQTGLATSANGGSTTLRNVPDLAMEGDFDNYACSLGVCEQGYAGTSFAAPRWAGFMALVNQQAVESGNAPSGGLGFINPAIYQLAQAPATSADFHDVTVGNNDTANQPLWFNAEPDYDLTTGWGSANGQQLINDLAGPQVPGFWLASSQNTIGVNPGGTATATILVTDAGGFSGSVNLAITSALPSGVTASFSPNPTTGSTILTVSASSAAPSANQTVTLTGTSGSITASTNVTVAVHAPSFALSALPASVGINQGSTGTSTISVQSLYGFNGAVALSIAGLPAGVTASFSPTSTSGTSVLTLAVSSSAAPATSTLTVTGTSGSLTATTSISLAVHGPSFTLSTQASVNMGQGSSASAYVYVNDQYGFTGSVNLAISGLPSGVTASFSPNSTTGTSILTFIASSSATPGQSLVTITGTSGSLTATATINLGVFAPTFLLASSGSLSLGQGSSTNTYVYVTDLYGFSGLVNLAVSGLPTGVTASFSPNPTSGTSSVTFTASSSASVGQSTVTITGTSGSVSATTTIQLGVFKPTFTLTSSSSVGIGQGNSISTSVYVNDQYGFAGSVSLAVSGLPSGVTAVFSPNPTTGTSILNLTASSSAGVGHSLITITGTSGSITSSTTIDVGVFTPTFTLSGGTGLSIGQGSSGTSYIYVNNQYGFTGSVNLAVSGLPNGVTASFSPNPTTGSSLLTLTASSSAAVGQSVVTITGTSGSVTATTTISLGVYAPTFTLIGGGAVNIGQGSTVTNYIYVNGQYGFNGSVNLAVSGLPNGVTASFSPNPTTGNSILTLTASSSTPLGQSVVTVTGTSGSVSATTTINLGVFAPTFTLSSGGSVSIGQGSSGTAYVYVNPQYGFTGSVALSVAGLPSGVTTLWTPNPTNGTSTLTLSVSNSAPAGQYNLTVTGVYGSRTSTTTLTLGIYAPSFTVSTYSSVNLGQGNSGSASIYISPLYGFTGSVTLSVSGLPSGVTASFSPNPTTASSTLTLTASSTAAVGQYLLTITGTSGTQTASTTLSFGVFVPGFTLSDYNNISVGQGASSTSYVNVNPQYGFTGNVTLSISGLPSGVTASFSPNPTTGLSLLTVNAGSTATVGQYTLLITGTSGTQTSSTTLILGIYAQTFTVSTYTSVSLGQGGSGTAYVYVNPQYGFTGNVTLSVSGLPSGVTASFSTNPATANSILTLTASGTAALGQYLLTVTGSSGGITATTSLTLTVNANGFTLSGPSGFTAGQGTSTYAYVYVNALSGGTAPNVTLSVSGLPSGVTAAFSTNPTNSGSSLLLTVGASVPTGTSTVTITGTSGSQVATTTFPLTIAAPSFTLYSGYSALSLNQGGSGSASFYVELQNGFSGNVTFSASGLPSGVTAAFSPNPTTGSSNLTLSASSTATPGTATITITGTSGSAMASATLLLTVYASSFTISASPSEALLLPGGSRPITLIAVSQYGFSGNITYAVTGLPSGVTASISPNPSSSTSTLTLTAAPTAVPVSGTVTITGTSGSLTAATTLSVGVISSPSPTAATLTHCLGREPGIHCRFRRAGQLPRQFVTAGSTPLTTGQVNFCDTTATSCDALHLIGVAQLTNAGTAALQFIPSAGPHNYKAFFSGTHANAASASAASSLSVMASLPSTTTIAQSGTSGGYTLTATVTGQGPVAPSGNASFLDTTDGNFSLGSAALGSGTATFSMNVSQSPTVGTAPEAITAGDFNGDGIPDLAVANTTSSTVTILLGNGDGTFTSFATLETGAGPDSIAVGDFNRDGRLDVVVASSTSGGVNVLLGNGDGTFTPSGFSPQTGSSPASMAVGDYNGDGLLDLAVANSGSGTDHGLCSATATAPSPHRASSPVVGSSPRSIVQGDFNGDGITDLAVANSGAGTVSLLLGVGDGTFGVIAPVSTNYYPASLAVGDLNGDGKLDLAVGSQYNTNTVTVLLGNGDGTFTAGATPPTYYNGVTVAIADFNGDGKADIVTANIAGSNSTLFLGNGDGTFAAGVSTATGSSPEAIIVGDWNGDGIKDVAVANSSSNTLTIIASQLAQKSTATRSGISPIGQGQHAVKASYPGDGVYAGSASATTSLTAASGAPAVTLNLSPASITTIQPLTVTVVVSGGSANPVPTGSVQLSASGYTSAAVSLSSGSAVITVPAGSFLPGTDALSASYVPDSAGSSLYSSASGTASVTVTKATPILAWATPAPIAYGTALTGVQLNATASVPGSFLYSPAADSFPLQEPRPSRPPSRLRTQSITPRPSSVSRLPSIRPTASGSQTGTAASAGSRHRARPSHPPVRQAAATASRSTLAAISGASTKAPAASRSSRRQARASRAIAAAVSAIRPTWPSTAGGFSGSRTATTRSRLSASRARPRSHPLTAYRFQRRHPSTSMDPATSGSQMPETTRSPR